MLSIRTLGIITKDKGIYFHSLSTGVVPPIFEPLCVYCFPWDMNYMMYFLSDPTAGLDSCEVYKNLLYYYSVVVRSQVLEVSCYGKYEELSLF